MPDYSGVTLLSLVIYRALRQTGGSPTTVLGDPNPQCRGTAPRSIQGSPAFQRIIDTDFCRFCNLTTVYTLIPDRKQDKCEGKELRSKGQEEKV